MNILLFRILRITLGFVFVLFIFKPILGEGWKKERVEKAREMEMG
jgi:hypothetical protein